MSNFVSIDLSKILGRKQRLLNNGEQMFNEPVERELLDGVPWLSGQKPQLHTHLQLLVNEQQQRRDIWELPKKNSPEPGPTKMHFHNSKSS
jgi:hypothetical protein